MGDAVRSTHARIVAGVDQRVWERHRPTWLADDAEWAAFLEHCDVVHALGVDEPWHQPRALTALADAVAMTRVHDAADRWARWRRM